MKKKVYKDWLAGRLEERCALSPKIAAMVVDTVVEEIKESMLNHQDVVLTNFGTFKTYLHKGGTSRNPAKNVEIKIGPNYRGKFKLSEKLRKLIKDSGNN